MTSLALSVFMDRMRGAAMAVAVLALLASAASMSAQETPAAVSEHAATPPAFGVLVGQWVRPDGGYVISINGVDAQGRLDASYANPNPLPFSKAMAGKDGSTITLAFEITAGGYNGSTYTLAYDAGSDTLKGVYYQAVVKQKFDVHFQRKTKSDPSNP